MPEAVKKLVVMNVNEVEKVASTVDFVFSAVDMSKEEIKAIEEAYAKTETPVVSNNSAHRWTPDVPMVVPEINPEHFEVIEYPEETSGNHQRLCCSKTELLHSELCTGSDCMEGVRALRSGSHHLSGHFRSRKDLQGLAGDGRKHHSLISAVRKRRASRSRFVSGVRSRMA